MPEFAPIDPVKIVAVLSVLVLTPPIAALAPTSVEALTVPVEIRLALRLGVLIEAACRRPVVWSVLVRILLVLVMFPELRVVNPPITPAIELVAVRFVAKISLQSTMSFWSQSIVEMAGKYAQSDTDEMLDVVAIGTPFSSNVAPKPPPPVSKVLPSRVMLVVLMEER
jgi:hypothetical protein